MDKALRRLILILALCSSAFGQQILSPIFQAKPAGGGGTNPVLAFANSVTNGNGCGTGGTPCTYAFSSAYTAASFASVDICWQLASGNLTSVTGSVTGAWTVRAATLINDATDTWTCEVADATNTATSGTDTLSVVFSGGTVFHSAAMMTNWTGVTTFDTGSSQNDSTASTTPASPAITTTVANELVIAYFFQTGNSFATVTAGSGFALLFTSTAAMAAEYQVKAFAGSVTPSITLSASTSALATSVSYK